MRQAIRSDRLQSSSRSLPVMETSLHRQLKALYSSGPSCREVGVDGFRVDAVSKGRLIEIQYGSLGSIRDKISTLLARNDVLIVKPLAARKFLVRRHRKGGRIVSSRYSPSRQSYYNLFDDLVHFVGVFPHPRLTLEAVLTEQEEHRLPADRRRWSRKSYRVDDRMLRAIQGRRQFRSAADLLQLIPDSLPETFTTADIARAAEIPRWLAQKMAYCLRRTHAALPVGKQGNTILYRLDGQTSRAA